MNNNPCFHTTSSRISASAGTGKTYQLASRYIALLMLGAAPDSIIALTFTKKAAGEFRSRILHALAEGACDIKDKHGRNVLTARVWDAWSGCSQDGNKNIVPASNDIPLFPATRPVVRRAAAENMYPEELYAQDQELQQYLNLPQASAHTFRELLQKTVKVLSKLKLSTIDSFFNTLVTGSCLELGVDAVTPLEPTDEPRVRHMSVGEYLEANSTDESKRAEFLRMFARLTKGESKRTFSALEEAIKAHLPLFRSHSSKDVWGNTDYFSSHSTADFSSMNGPDIEQWNADAAELRSLLAARSEDDFNSHVYSGLLKLAGGQCNLSQTAAQWLGAKATFEQMETLAEAAKELMGKFDSNTQAEGYDGIRELAELSYWKTDHKNALNDIIDKVGKGKFRNTQKIDALRAMLAHVDEINNIWQFARRLRAAQPAKLLGEAKERTRCLYSLLRDYADTYEQRIMTTGEFDFADIARRRASS